MMNRSIRLIALLMLLRPVSAATISGTVRNDAGTPLSGVFIDLYDEQGFFDFSFTGFDGTYLFQNLPGSTYYLHTDSQRSHVDEWWDMVPGFADNLFFNPIKANATPLTVQFLDTVTGIDFNLEPGARILGQVMSGGFPVTNAFVDSYLVNGTRLISALSDTNGLYTIAGLPGGTYTVRTDTLGMLVDEWQDGTVAFDGISPFEAGVAPFSLASGGTTTGINFSLQAGAEISGRVVDNGNKSVPGVFIDLVNSAGERLEFATTDVNGDFRLGGLPNGMYFTSTETSGSYVDLWYNQVLLVDPRDPLGDGASAIQVLGTNSINQVDFALTLGGMITGRVRGPSLVAVSNVYVDVYLETNFFDFALTDTGGNYSVPSLPAGNYYAKVDTLGAFLDEWYDDIILQDPLDPEGDGATLFTLSGFQTVSNIHFDLVLGAAFSGRLTDVLSNPLPGMFVDVVNPMGERLFFTQTDTNGHYQLGGINAGTYYLRTDTLGAFVDEWHDDQVVLAANDPSADGAQVYQLALGESVTNVNFALNAGGMLSGRVVFTNGAAIANTFIDVYRDTNLYASAQTDTGGYFSVTALPAGTYYLRTDTPLALVNEWYADVYIYHQGNPPVDGATPVVLGVDQTISNLVFELGLGADIEGNLSKQVTAEGLSDQVIDLFDASGTFYDSVITGSEGFYALQLLPPGDWYVGTDALAFLQDEWYNDVLRTQILDPFADGASVITLEDGTVRIEVDIALFPYIQAVEMLNVISNIVSMTWSSVDQLPYQVERSTNLVSGVWTNSPSGTLPQQQSLQLGTGGNLLYDDPMPAERMGFYRIIPQ
jgi:hypothetical protein